MTALFSSLARTYTFSLARSLAARAFSSTVGVRIDGTRTLLLRADSGRPPPPAPAPPFPPAPPPAPPPPRAAAADNDIDDASAPEEEDEEEDEERAGDALGADAGRPAAAAAGAARRYDAGRWIRTGRTTSVCVRVPSARVRISRCGGSDAP